jgi:Gas vesicle synthesis protein GvpL/GvpF
MTLLVYAVTRGLSSIRGTGLRGAPLRRVSIGGLAAVISHLQAPPTATGRLLLQYERAVEGLMADHEILPVRFGSVFADESVARDMLRERDEELLGLLGRVGGAVEFAISAGWRSGEDQIAAVPENGNGKGAGTAYILGRLERHHRLSAVAQRLDPLKTVARSTRQRVLPRATLPISGAYLVDHGRGEEFAALVRRLGDRLHDVELVCSGPWPPYSFVQGTAA